MYQLIITIITVAPSITAASETLRLNSVVFGYVTLVISSLTFAECVRPPDHGRQCQKQTAAVLVL